MLPVNLILLIDVIPTKLCGHQSAARCGNKAHGLDSRLGKDWNLIDMASQSIKQYLAVC